MNVKRVTKIETYHWNNAQGTTPGTIGLQSSDGKTYGPWQAEGSPGHNNVADAFWTVTPDEVIQPGTYQVIDSDQATWSQNADSKGVGFTKIYARPAK